MARPKIELKARALKQAVKLYEKGEGLVILAEKYGVSLPVIRRVLAEAGVTIRGRGRPVTA